MRRVGPRGVLLDVPDAQAAAATAVRLHRLVRDGVLPEVAIVPGAASVLVEAVEVPLEDRVLGLLAGCVVADAAADAAIEGPLVEVPVSWDGPDLDAVAACRVREGQLTKPPGALGRLEGMSEWLCAWQAQHPPKSERVVVAVFAGEICHSC